MGYPFTKITMVVRESKKSNDVFEIYEKTAIVSLIPVVTRVSEKKSARQAERRKEKVRGGGGLPPTLAKE